MAGYTIGQLANIMGISRDKLRYYEEKGILRPRQNDDNNYREYDVSDMDTVLLIEFYRSLDLDFKTIKNLHENSHLKDIEFIFEKKHEEVLNEINRLKAIAGRIERAKKSCMDIEKNLNVFSIRPMTPCRVLGAISDFRSYDEFDVIHTNIKDEAPIIKSLKRYITFNDQGIASNNMFVTKEIESVELGDDENILHFDKCIYTIVQDGAKNKNVMMDTFMKSMEYIHTNGFTHQGIAIISMLLIEYNEGYANSYLEIYIPIK